MNEQRLSIDVDGTAVSAIASQPADAAAATVVIAHGAGAGMEHPFLAGFARAMTEAGLATLRFNFPYREAGRRFPDRPPAAIAAWNAVFEAAAQSGGPVWACGKSFGGRMASMAVAEGMPAAGLVFLGYPLHPPGKPEKLRDEHLYGIRSPMLFLQGTRDPFATPAELEAVVQRIGTPPARLQWIEGGGHSFDVAGVRRPADQVGASLAPAVAAFITDRAAD